MFSGHFTDDPVFDADCPSSAVDTI